ncbi:hypothetical protein CFIMG_000715RA [Ceratocystis fimbriata CBS 114723]|uniref:Protein byr4 n=1 Tax=Ceratocystis fimbriata CBS 114723 TaxID=1035309 RepID=A0A2C5X540_9PEZI|nr:hypothetical protein CFIMG_000715RA [Ceratocystis fimbriata CBS 114723]
MPRFFTKRKQSVPEDTPAPSFRVLDRSQVNSGSSFNHPAKSATAPDGFRNLTGPGSRSSTLFDHDESDNLFAGMKIHRGSGSSNTTKTASTDTSSRHSGASTAPSSAAHNSDQDDAKNNRPSLSKSATSSFLGRAGRTFSFTSTKKNNEEDLTAPPVPQIPEGHLDSGRSRGLTVSTTSTALSNSTSSTATPPRVGDRNSQFDFGGDFGSMFNTFDNGNKRSSVATVTGRSLTAVRPNQPSPLNFDSISRVDAPPFSAAESRSSQDGLLASHSPRSHNVSPVASAKPKPSTPSLDREDEDTALLRDSIVASTPAEQRNVSIPRIVREHSIEAVREEADDDNMFDQTLVTSSQLAQKYVSGAPSSPRSRVMTPAQFEKYKNDRESGNVDAPSNADTNGDDDDDDVNYDDDDDDLEKAKELAKQRKKQEAHMAVYRQQMMKVTGESASGPRPDMMTSMSTPNLMKTGPPSPNIADDISDEDEEVPLAILAAHGFPNKSKPPARLNQMSSNPNLRQSLQPSYQRPGSSMGAGPEAPPATTGGRSGPLPAFARNLPQDPFVGAGLVRQAPRESIAMSGGAPHPAIPPVGATPGGLVGIIASEERSRALRRGGSPNIEANAARNPNFNPSGLLGHQYTNVSGGLQNSMGMNGGSMGMNGGMGMGMNGGMGMGMGMNGGNSLYSMGASPSVPQLNSMNQGNDQMAQMQQLMQMQMQFMQMQMQMNAQTSGMRPMSTIGSISGMPPMMNGANGMGMGMGMDNRASFIAPDAGGIGYMDNGMRTMSMVQPSSASWVQKGGFVPSIRMQGDYTPSIAPSERSNIGLPGRYRPVSNMPASKTTGNLRRISSMAGITNELDLQTGISTPDNMHRAASASPSKFLSPQTPTRSPQSDDEDDDEGWEAMKAKRDKKRSLWKSKKETTPGLSALIL